MIDGEVVSPADRGKHRRDHVLGYIVDTLTIRADEMVVVLSVARDVRRDMTVALETARHPVLDLLLERPVDRRSPNRRVCFSNPLIELLRGERAFRRREGPSDEDSLLGAPAPARCKPRGNGRGHHDPSITTSNAI